MSEYIVDFGDDAKSAVRMAMARQHGAEMRGGIVRCADCEHYNSYQDLCERLKPGMVVMGDGFCAWGERIEP